MTTQDVKLSEKEKELIRLKAEGHTLREIARLLITSKRYVEQIINDLYKKTGCRNGSQLVAWSYKYGHLEINTENLPINERKAG